MATYSHVSGIPAYFPLTGDTTGVLVTLQTAEATVLVLKLTFVRQTLCFGLNELFLGLISWLIRGALKKFRLLMDTVKAEREEKGWYDAGKGR